MGLKSEKLRPFWLSLRQEEKSQFDSVSYFSYTKQVFFNIKKLSKNFGINFFVFH